MDSKDRQYKKMTETGVSTLIVKLAIPTIFSMLITSIYNLADTYFVGKLSTSASGAVGIVSSLMAIIQAFGFMYGHGCGSVASRMLGRKDTDGATRFLSTSFFLALLTGSVITVSGLLFLEPFMNLLGSTPTILPHAKDYALYILLACPFMMSSVVLNNLLRYEGKAVHSMAGLVSGGLINIFLDWVFVMKLGMGTGGAGLATAISQCISFVLLLSVFIMGKTTSKIRIKCFTRSFKDIWTIVLTGFPSFSRQGLASIAGMLLNIAAKEWGDPAVAAMSIISRIFLFLMAIMLGIGQGFQPVAAFNYGAKKYLRVRKAALFTMLTSFISTCFFIVLCLIFAEDFIKLFRDDIEVTKIALPAFRYQTLAMVFQPVIVVSNMLFQSVGKSVRASFLAMCRQGLYFIPLILFLPSVMGVTGIQICQPLSDGLTFLTSLPFLIAFLHHLKHKEDNSLKEKRYE